MDTAFEELIAQHAAVKASQNALEQAIEARAWFALELFSKGVTLREISECLDVSWWTVCCWLRQVGYMKALD